MKALLVALVVSLAVTQAAPQPEPTIEEWLTDAEAQYELPSGLLRAVAWVESKMNPNAVGSAGEVGLMQLHPRYHNIGGGIVGQIHTAAKYLRQMIERFGLDLGIAAYNQGPRNPKYSEYVRRVKEAWQRIR